MSRVLRPMTLQDVPSVVHLDYLSFSNPWSARSYAYEVSQSDYSYMVVLEETLPIPSQTTLWQQFHQWLGITPRPVTVLLAYAGMWKFEDTAHISTLASHPNHRHQGWGKLILLAQLMRASELEAERVSLEVRASNTIAQNLYQQMGFQQTGIKHGYYSDNQEDAWVMVLSLASHLETLRERYQQLKQAHHIEDRYTMAE
ncbi:MAG: GNAT family N-acetyltransferase [Phototrophicaceae bacterium]